MAFPAIVGTPVTTSIVTAAASGTINIPPGAAGNLLLMIVRIAPLSGISITGFTELYTGSDDPADDQTSILYRVMDGTEGSTTGYSFGVTARASAICWEISGAISPSTQPPQLSTVATGTATQPNSTAVTPAGGAKDYLYGVIYGMEGEQTGIDASNPANYTLGRQFIGTGTSGAVTGNCTVGGAWRQLNSASEDPGAWAVTGTLDDWSAWTIAIHPPPPPTISAVDTPLAHGQAGITITGANFEATQGAGYVELASSATYASATKVGQAVTSWSALGIAIEFTANAAGLTPGTVYVFVTSTSGGVSNGFAVTLLPGASWLAALNTGISVNVTSGNALVRLRVGITNSGSNGATAYKWQYSKNGGTLTDITDVSANVWTFLTAYFADGDDVPQLITGGAYDTDNHAAEESSGAFTMLTGLAGSTSIESEIALELIADDLANADTLEFYIVEADGTPLDTYTEVPMITMIKGVAAAASLVIPAGVARRIGQLY
jgi:hypothetical protein